MCEKGEPDSGVPHVVLVEGAEVLEDADALQCGRPEGYLASEFCGRINISGFSNGMCQRRLFAVTTPVDFPLCSVMGPIILAQSSNSFCGYVGMPYRCRHLPEQVDRPAATARSAPLADEAAISESG